MLFMFRASGPYALWTPAWLRADPLSEPVPTPSGLGGLLRAYHRKPEWAWEIDSYAILSPIRYETLARSARKSAGEDPERMPQRRTVLVDVDYLICARVHVYAGALDPARRRVPSDYGPILHKRLARGVPDRAPHGGQSEFTLDVRYLGPAQRGGAPALHDVCTELGVQPIETTEDLGPMLVDLLHDGGPVFQDERVQPIYRRLRLDHGLVEVPEEAYTEKRHLDEEAQIMYRARYGHQPKVSHAAL